jgi:hypothetical protein
LYHLQRNSSNPFAASHLQQQQQQQQQKLQQEQLDNERREQLHKRVLKGVLYTTTTLFIVNIVVSLGAMLFRA